MNKTIARRNALSPVSSHRRRARVQARTMTLQKWWEKFAETDYGVFKMWSRQEKKQWLMAGSNAYDKWLVRYNKHKAMDPNMPLIVGRHVLVPQDVCWSKDRKLRISLVKVNAQGRRRKF